MPPWKFLWPWVPIPLVWMPWSGSWLICLSFYKKLLNYFARWWHRVIFWSAMPKGTGSSGSSVCSRRCMGVARCTWRFHFPNVLLSWVFSCTLVSRSHILTGVLEPLASWLLYLSRFSRIFIRDTAHGQTGNLQILTPSLSLFASSDEVQFISFFSTMIMFLSHVRNFCPSPTFYP